MVDDWGQGGQREGDEGRVDLPNNLTPLIHPTGRPWGGGEVGGRGTGVEGVVGGFRDVLNPQPPSSHPQTHHITTGKTIDGWIPGWFRDDGLLVGLGGG